MSEPYVGEIRMFAGNFAPRGWSFCDGQLMAVSQNDALFSLLGTVYGGDGRTTFGLPDFRGRIPVHAGIGPGLSPRRLGAKGGEERVTLTPNQIPSHRHTAFATDANASSSSPANSVLAKNTSVDAYTNDTSVGLTPLNPNSIAATGGSLPHTNMGPSLAVNFIIALFGIYPSRS